MSRCYHFSPLLPQTLPLAHLADQVDSSLPPSCPRMLVFKRSYTPPATRIVGRDSEHAAISQFSGIPGTEKTAFANAGLSSMSSYAQIIFFTNCMALNSIDSLSECGRKSEEDQRPRCDKNLPSKHQSQSSAFMGICDISTLTQLT